MMKVAMIGGAVGLAVLGFFIVACSTPAEKAAAVAFACEIELHGGGAAAEKALVDSAGQDAQSVAPLVEVVVAAAKDIADEKCAAIAHDRSAPPKP